ncbi:MAG: redoxin domain-containing protein, partial [Phycisphaerae bacterium]|nr:redoxin domain-containing protein [Phycisphaerae bacterium]
MPRSFFSALIPLFLAAACSANPGIDPAQWNDRSILPAERAVLERSVGHAPAAFDESMKWFSGTPTTWPQLRGRVVILQSFSSSATGRTALTKLTNFMSRADPAKVTAIAVHTPEKADDAFAFVGGATLGFPIVLDSVGRFCDDMGLWKTPTIILVDRAGVVRAAGVSTSKLQAAVTALLDEPFDETAAPPTAVTPRAAAAADSQKASKKPAYPSVSPRGGAVNLIGKQGPPLAVESWVNDQPNTQGKVIIVDFWATWCAPCRDSIPHMNELAAKFKDSVVAVGLSDEDPKVIQ